MSALLDNMYYKLRKEEIERATAKFKSIKPEEILERLAKLGWEYNIQLKVLLKTRDRLTVKLIGNQETVVLKYHAIDLVSVKDTDYFMHQLDENEAHRGVYITTGKFQRLQGRGLRRLLYKRDCIFEDGFSFVKRHLGIIGKADSNFQAEGLNLLKYLPL